MIILDEHYISLVAVNVLNDYLLSHSLIPSNGWDIDDPNCCKRIPNHIIFTVCGRVSNAEKIDIEKLWDNFLKYIFQHNKLINAVKFTPFDLEVQEYSGVQYVFLSVAY